MHVREGIKYMAPKMIISYIKINNITITVLRYKRNGKDRRLSTKK
jgi:hypothetical protein